jgi:small ligand-binding sensory domain FIST
MSMQRTSSDLVRLAAGVSGNPDHERAIEQVCSQVSASLAGSSGGSVQSPDLVVVFASRHHLDSLERISEQIRRDLKPGSLIGVTGESVLGGRTELERTPGISMLAAMMPGVSMHTYTGRDLFPNDETPDGLARLGRAMGADSDLRCSIIFADPFSIPMGGLLPAMARARAYGQVGALVGGMASGGSSPGGNGLLLDDRVYRAGLVGVSLRGAVRVDTVVSQGCRGVGQPMVVTKARKNIILQLGGRPALQVVREIVEELPEDDKKLLEKGLFIGIVINEYKDRFGRDDFLIRNVVGVDEHHDAVALNAMLRVGQTVRFHLRDAKTADEDLGLLLDAQQLREPPVGAMLVTCNSRGSRLFDNPHHDASMVARAFSSTPAGEELARGGEAITAQPPSLPLAGFFANGEIGPVGAESYLHAHSACLTLFRTPK